MTDIPEQPIECFQCGICCMRYQPRVSEKEMASMAQHLGLTRETFVKKYVMITRIGYLLRQRDGMCVFLEQEKDGNKALCRIHDHRPAPCRDWAAGLSKRECRQGLAQLGNADRIAVLREVFDSAEAMERFTESLQ